MSELRPTSQTGAIVHLTIPGEPQGKGRPKFSVVAGHANVRTPDQTVIYENFVRLEYKQNYGGGKFADDASLKIKVVAYYSIPKSASRKKRSGMQDGIIRPTKKPDADNILKVVADALNGFAYRDDSQIVEAVVSKLYSEQPRVEVVLEEIL